MRSQPTRATRSRRRFLAIAGVTVGATAFACSGLTVLGTRQPQPIVDFPEITLGDTTTSKAILVAYASRAGSTGGVAEAIGRTLAEGGSPVEVRLMKDVKDVTPYRAVVAGSAVHGGQWLPEAMQFTQTHSATLAQKPFAAFFVCMTLTMENEQYRQGVGDCLKPVRALVKPASAGRFAGALDCSKLPLVPDGLILRAIAAAGVWSEGDHRDWDAIRAWAADLRPIMA